MTHTISPELEKAFKEKFGGAMAWIALNCKNEIIDGVGMDHLGNILLSFIAEQIAVAERRTLEMVEDKLRHYTVVCRESQRAADINVKQFMSLLSPDNKQEI